MKSWATLWAECLTSFHTMSNEIKFHIETSKKIFWINWEEPYNNLTNKVLKDIKDNDVKEISEIRARPDVTIARGFPSKIIGGSLIFLMGFICWYWVMMYNNSFENSTPTYINESGIKSSSVYYGDYETHIDSCRWGSLETIK